MNVDKLRALFEASKNKYGDAKEMGTTYVNIMKILKNGSDMKVSTLEGIAKFYGVPVGYFFDEAEADGQLLRDLEIERLKGQIKGMQDAIERLGFSLKGFIIDDN